MADDLFQGLPPPSAVPERPSSVVDPNVPPAPPAPAPAPALKSALKRERHLEPRNEEVPQKKLRFKTSVDATETQVIEAMRKIAAHIINPSKFSKASKLAVQLIQAGSVKSGTSDYFFAILEAAMSLPSGSTDPSLRMDYHYLFSAAQDITECLNEKQKQQFIIWTIRAVVANDLYTDDSFVFSKTAAKIKEAIDSLQPATAADDADEAEALSKTENGADVVQCHSDEDPPSAATEPGEVASDPFGLDALLPTTSRNDSKSRERIPEDDESKMFLKMRREALLSCLEIAARRYKTPWTQTVIDILVKHAFDNRGRFMRQQGEAIKKLWASVMEQQIRRKQGKSSSGKLDMNAFERLQEKYSREKISIRNAVGGGGERKAEQWLG